MTQYKTKIWTPIAARVGFGSNVGRLRAGGARKEGSRLTLGLERAVMGAITRDHQRLRPLVPVPSDRSTIFPRMVFRSFGESFDVL